MSSQAPPSTSRVERKKEETKRKIIQAAMQLFQIQGFDATTMEHIANTVDIAKGTLYNYFPVKEAILSEYIQRSFQKKNMERIARLRELPDTRTRMISILSELVAGAQAHKEIFERFLVYRVQSILSLHKTESEKSGIELLAAEIIFLGQKAGEIRADLPPGLLEDQFEFVFIEIIKQISVEPETRNTGAVIERCVDLFINGARIEKTN